MKKVYVAFDFSSSYCLLREAFTSRKAADTYYKELGYRYSKTKNLYTNLVTGSHIKLRVIECRT